MLKLSYLKFMYDLLLETRIPINRLTSLPETTKNESNFLKVILCKFAGIFHH